MITAQKNDNCGSNLQIQNPSCFKVCKHIKQQTTKLQLVLIRNSTLPCVDVEANIVIVIFSFAIIVIEWTFTKL